MKKVYFLFFTSLLYAAKTYAQVEIPKGWHLLDVQTDSFYGISLDKAYQFLQQKKIKSNTVTVAVLDSGVDTLQEDLKNVLWHNTKEIPNNNIDDDNNGYIDDVYGWNFLGNKNGENVKSTTTEAARIYHKYKTEFLGKKIDVNNLSVLQAQEYKLWEIAAKKLNVSTEKEIEVTLVTMTLNSIKSCDKILKKAMNVEEYTSIELEKFKPQTTEAKNSKLNYLLNVQLLQIELDEKNTAVINQLEEYLAITKKSVAAKDEVPIDYRKTIIKDDYNNINDKFYGNSNVSAAFIMHGTHVAGIIGAQRNNNLGVDGVADDVKVMPVRVVPEGDEFDKDIALGIFYAVNNGAKVINMSFGKELSPQKYWIDSAIKYAASKDVLIVHAAGNDAEDIDSIENFPTPFYNNKGSRAANFITVGASTDPKISNAGFVANFSSYGKNTVDVFAPGVKIFSTMPGINNYANQQGTSMAAPVVSGIAALLRSYFPKLTAIQVKDIIEKSVTIPNEKNDIAITLATSNNDKLLLKDACKTGGIVNAAKAVELAYNITLEIKN